MIYLDTHVVVWLFAGRLDKLTGKVTELINKKEIAVSPIVRLELQYLFEIQRITVHANEIVTDLFDRIGLKICSKDFNAVINSAFALDWTRDPFDRIIVANASINHDILVSKDQSILKNYDNAVW